MACLVVRERIIRSQHQAERAREDFESVEELLTPMSGSTME